MSDINSTETFVTPYAASKYLSTERNVTVRAQMMYNYVNKKYIASTDGKIALSDLNAWCDKYVAKKIANAEKIMNELNGS